jgi:ketosteroid isomerase-like protein
VSRENVEFVKAFLEAGPKMDKATMLAALPVLIPQICDPDIEWMEDPQRADGRVYRGHGGVRESIERWLEQWDRYEVTFDSLVDCGDAVLVVAREHARGARSGADVSSTIYLVITIRDSKILRYQEFYDEQAAREAAGPPA